MALLAISIAWRLFTAVFVFTKSEFWHPVHFDWPVGLILVISLWQPFWGGVLFPSFLPYPPPPPLFHFLETKMAENLLDRTKFMNTRKKPALQASCNHSEIESGTKREQPWGRVLSIWGDYWKFWKEALRSIKILFCRHSFYLFSPLRGTHF